MALLFVFALFGCNKQNSVTPPAINPSFESDVKISFNDVKITCYLKQTDFNDAQIEIFTPKELNGFTIMRSQDKCSLKFKEMNYQLDLSKFPKASFAQIMTDAYSQLVNSEGVKIKKQDKYWIYEGKIDSGNFKITQNDDTGFVEKIEVPQVGMTAEFSNIKSIATKQ
ncbi:MAG: hypothetical protein RSD17_02490 [Oscillospiraceae bacterium]